LRPRLSRWDRSEYQGNGNSGFEMPYVLPLTIGR